MQELVIVSYCDRCYQTDQAKVDSSAEVEVVVGDQKARLDLCDSCNQDLLDPVRALLRAREAAQRALDKSTNTAAARESRAAASAPEPPPTPLVRCGECGDKMQIRHRGQHVRTRHEGARPEDLTWHFDDVDTVWTCSCGLPFPTEHGRNIHCRRTRHPLPEEAGPQTPAAAR